MPRFSTYGRNDRVSITEHRRRRTHPGSQRPSMDQEDINAVVERVLEPMKLRVTTTANELKLMKFHLESLDERVSLLEDQVTNDRGWMESVDVTEFLVLRQQFGDLKHQLLNLTRTMSTPSEPNLPSREPNLPSQEPNLPSKEPILSSKEPILSSKEPTPPSPEPLLLDRACSVLENHWERPYASAAPQSGGQPKGMKGISSLSVLNDHHEGKAIIPQTTKQGSQKAALPSEIAKMMQESSRGVVCNQLTKATRVTTPTTVVPSTWSLSTEGQCRLLSSSYEESCGHDSTSFNDVVEIFPPLDYCLHLPLPKRSVRFTLPSEEDT